MQVLKARKERLEDRQTQRAAMKEKKAEELARQREVLEDREEDDVAPMTTEYADDLTLGMFGDVVTVTTQLGSLGDDEDEDPVAGNAGAWTRPGASTVDEAQAYARSYKSAREKIDSKPLSTKQQRRNQRKKSQSTLESKGAGKTKKEKKGKGNKRAAAGEGGS